MNLGLLLILFFDTVLCFLDYLVSENLSDTPKSLVEVG